MSNYKFIVNPTASRGKGIFMGKWLEKECPKRKLDFDIQYTTQPGEATDIAAESINNFKSIVAVGGDGTLQEVVNGLMESDINIGVIPVGTGNDFIRVVNIPNQPDQALNIVIEGYTRKIDVGKINNRIFHNAVGIGFDAWAVHESLKIKKLRGHAVYLYAILKTILTYKAPVMELSYNDKIITEKLLLTAIGNGTCVGGGIKMTPFAKIDDGLLDLTIIQDVNKLKMLQNLAKTYSGEHVKMPQVKVDTSKSIVIRSEEELAVHADGELMGCNLKEVEINILTKAIRFVVPKKNN